VTTIDLPTARRIAVRAALLEGEPLPPDEKSVVEVARHFGGIQIDPTRTVERTQHLVLWSRVARYDRALLDSVLETRKAFEYNAFVMTPEMLPELYYHADVWATGIGDWRQRARDFLAGNHEFRQQVLDRLAKDGPLPSRAFDASSVKVGWESSGWTNEKNTTRMLDFMGVKMDVVVAGRVGHERLWDLPERVLPRGADRKPLTRDKYEESRVMRAMRRFGVATQQEIRLRAYGLSIPDAKAILARLVDQGTRFEVDLPYPGKAMPAFALPEAVEAAAQATEPRTTLLSPFDPLVYDRERTERMFGFSYKLEMYKPKDKRQFGHFVLPILHHNQLIGRLDSERDRKTNELVVRQLHWEGKTPDKQTRAAVDRAVEELARFVREG